MWVGVVITLFKLGVEQQLCAKTINVVSWSAIKYPDSAFVVTAPTQATYRLVYLMIKVLE